MPTSDEALAIAVEHLQAGRWQAAEQGLRNVLAEYPNHAGAWHQLGILAFQVGKHDTAIELIGRAIELNGSDANCHVNLGNAFLAQDKFDRAIDCYRQALALKPDHSIAHYNLSIAFQALGKLPESVDSYVRALEPRPDYAVAHYNLGNTLRAQGKLDLAAASFQRAIQLNPEHAEAHNNLGNAFLAQKKLHEAVNCFHRALELKPSFAEAHSNLGNALLAQGKPGEAIPAYRRALELNADLAEVHHNLGNALQALENTNDAIDCFRRALALEPQLPEAHMNLGNALQAQGKLDEARAAHYRALELKPDYAEAHYNLGNVLQAQGQAAEAVPFYRKALELRPDDAGTHNNLGAALRTLGRLYDAVAAYRRALELKPQDAGSHNNLAAALQLQGNLDEALAFYNSALDLDPNHAGAHYNRSMLVLSRGDFERGWPEYEWRWKIGQLPDRVFPQPLWDTSPLGERTMFLHVEQGFGDTFQFIRYAALLKKQNPAATVIAECQPPVKKLLARCPGFDQLIAEGDKLPAFDVYSPLITLPRLLATTLETVPGDVPYLFADPTLNERWRNRLASVRGFRIGINWRGRHGHGEFRKRDIPEEYFAALAKIPGVALVRLQKGDAGDNLARYGDQTTIFDPGPDFDTTAGPFMDTAALMMNVDLVISSDTSVPHLAGALGVPIWLALPFASDWRWLLDRHDSPWYPTMRLFRQESPGDWSSVFAEIQVALRAIIQVWNQ
jgi:tetratricopeptide (TPR) repeat protein